MSSPANFQDVAVSAATSQGAIATGAILAVGAVAFGIKGLWVGWRGGSKAMGKTGT